MKKIALFLVFWLFTAGRGLFPQERFRKTPPSPEPLQEFRLPAPETVPLSNGLKVSVVFRDSMPMMSLELILDAGEIRSPEKSPGLATFAANMFSRSTQFRSTEEIEELVESIGGSLTVTTSQDYVLLAFHFLDDYLDQALELISQMILQPNFSDREIASAKLALTYELLEKEKNPEFAAKRLLLRQLFKNHPYEKFAFFRDVIRTWNQKELAEFFDRFYRPNAAHLILIGNLSLKTATRKVSHYLNLWQPRDVPVLPLQAPKLPDRDKVCFIDVPQVRDCTIYLGTAFPASDTTDRFALAVLNQILGGTPNSRLFMALRESKGYAYFCFSETELFRMGGLFLVRARVTPEVVYPSVQEILKVAKAMARDPISSAEIEQAKSYLLGNFPIKIERYDSFAEHIAHSKAYNWGDEPWNKYYDQITLIGPEKISQAAQKYLLQPAIIIIAGDRNFLADRFGEFDSIEVYDNKGQYQYTVSKERSHE
jgi:predicted Zn-dependent peptidase